MAITNAQQARQLYRVGGVGGRAKEGSVERTNVQDVRSSGSGRSRIQQEQQSRNLRDLVNRQQEEKAFEPFESLIVRDFNFPGAIGTALNLLKGPRQKLLDTNIDSC